MEGVWEGEGRDGISRGGLGGLGTEHRGHIEHSVGTGSKQHGGLN